MSEILGTASVIIRPDTTKFRAELQAELAAATRGLVVPVEIAATAGKTGAAAAVTATTAASTAALEQNAVAAASDASALKALASVEEANVAIQEQIVVAQGAGTLSTTALAEAKAVLAASAKVAASAERNLAAALETGNAAAIAQARSLAVSARFQQLSARIATEEAAAQSRSASATVKSAAAHEQLARGAGASSLSLLGIRGATLAASSSFLIGAASVILTRKAIQAFSKEAESAARVTKVFGEVAGAELEQSAKRMADSLGLSASAALKYEGAIGEVFKNVHLAAAENAKFSESLVKVAVDSAAFNNVPVTEVLRAIQLALSGNLRGLRQFIPGVTAASIQLQALADTGKKTKEELTQQNLVVARAEQIQKLAANQAGTFADRQGDLAAQTKILESNIENLAATIGGPLAKAVTAIVFDLNLMFTGFKKIGGLDPFGESGKFQSALAFKAATDRVKDSLNLIDDAMNTTTGLTGPLGAAFQGLVGPLGVFGAAAAAASAQLSGLQEHLLDLEFTGASSARKIADLQGQIEAAQTIIRHPGRGGTKAQAQARQDRNAAQAQIAAIRAADKAAAEKNAADAKAAAAQALQIAQDAARKVQEALDAADQAFLDSLGLRRGGADLALLRAQATKGLEDDVKAQNAITALLKRSIAAAKVRITNTLLRAQTIQDLTSALVQSRQATRALIEQQKQEEADRRKLLADRAAERLDLSIQIAETNKNVAQEIALREARIKADREKIKSVHGDLVRRKQLQLEIAQDTQAIKELKKEQDKNKNAGAELAFSFLQTQQGFAANLLSNLLPLNAIAGTVGGGAISTPSAPAPGPSAPLATQAAASAAGAGGVTAGQGSAQIVVLRQILAVLHRLAGDRQHPEAHNQRSLSAADMAHPV